jgi:NAD(P)-dependent dehydrogenase (short-subunit alcohol dehydrogenase family)
MIGPYVPVGAAGNFRLDGKIAIVTGGGGAIGSATCRVLAGAGASVACLDLSLIAAQSVALEIVQKGGRAVALVCDVASEASVNKAISGAVAALGNCHVLVHCAAMLEKTAKITDYSLAEWNEVISTNLTGAFLVSRAVLPPMIAAGGGSIIHIASMHGNVARAGRAAYGTTKGGMIMLAKTMAVDHAPDNIRVNTISPGGVETSRTAFRYKDDPEGKRQTVSRYPLLRYGQPVEIANTALFLSSDASSFITGSDLAVDGGFTTL